jgi:hypothetical protein
MAETTAIDFRLAIVSIKRKKHITNTTKKWTNSVCFLESV